MRPLISKWSPSWLPVFFNNQLSMKWKSCKNIQPYINLKNKGNYAAEIAMKTIAHLFFSVCVFFNVNVVRLLWGDHFVILAPTSSDFCYVEPWISNNNELKYQLNEKLNNIPLFQSLYYEIQNEHQWMKKKLIRFKFIHFKQISVIQTSYFQTKKR